MTEIDNNTSDHETSGTERSEVPSLDDAYPDDYVHAKPLPPEHELDDAECHNCGEPWNGGEDWMYTCPGCGEETFEVGI